VELRSVYCEDAIGWMKVQTHQAQGRSYVTSLPDYSEFPQLCLADWKNWFQQTASLIFSCTDESGVSIFFQSDIKHEGEWIDKSYLIQKAAEEAGHKLLWHKIACRSPAGTATFGRPSYSHIICFSKSLKIDLAKSSADVLPELGEKTWPRGMGLKASLMVAQFIKEQTSSDTVVNPFCGEGSMLAAANHVGLKAIGIERGKKRAEKARVLSLKDMGWNLIL
jgi:hypothetical protein